ncbi:MAG: hypothetical protein JWM16_500 [Verrucomicrobiales bacterium]|nr:hypothetical protein [Verrucomicrobiales bacterium]
MDGLRVIEMNPLHPFTRQWDKVVTGLTVAVVLLSWGTSSPLTAAESQQGKAKISELEPPVFSIPGGVYTDNQRLNLQAGKAVVRFTTDGSEPQTNSPVFKTSLEITNSMVVRAKAWDPSGQASRTKTQSYELMGSDLARFESSLPLIVLDSCGNEISHQDKSLAAARVIQNKSGPNRLADKPQYEGLVNLNVRGHSSLRYPKHSYTVKTVNELGDGQKTSLLGLAKESDWVLYGPYPDKTLMRDALAYELSNQMGRWAPHYRFVEVFVNETSAKLGMNHYVGVYLLVEKITRDKDRVDIAKLDPSITHEPEISGGYILKKDHSPKTDRKNFGPEGPPQAGQVNDRAGYPTAPGGFPADPKGFLPPYQAKVTKTTTTPAKPKKPKRSVNSFAAKTNYLAAAIPAGKTLDDAASFEPEEGFHTRIQDVQFYFQEPEPDQIIGVQRAWLKNYINGLESALYGPDFRDAQKGYGAFLDADSFIDHHLLVETTKNVDGFRFSTFFHKDRGRLLKMGPAWDWNLSFGNASGKQGYMPEHWLWPQLDDQQYTWFRRLFEDPDFAQRYVDRWAQLRTNVLATSNILARVDQLAAELKEPQARNFARWEILGDEISPNYFVGATYQEEVTWMKDWITKRFAWIEEQFLPAPEWRVDKKLEFETKLADAKIYYTLDGSDPRARGGEVSSVAKAYGGPFDAPNGSKVSARLQKGSRWSPPTVFQAK